MFEEYGLTEYLKVWNGQTIPVSPSIIIDSVPRSGNIFLASAINKSFNNIFQRWGYLDFHNPNTFAVAPDHFDLTIVPIRNPIDSLASWVYFTQSIENEESIRLYISNFTHILSEVNKNKERLFLVKFEDIVNDINSVMSSIGDRLGINPVLVDQELLKDDVKEITKNSEGFYSVPNNNTSDLEIIKNKIVSLDSCKNQLEALVDIYNEIVYT